MRHFPRRLVGGPDVWEVVAVARDNDDDLVETAAGASLGLVQATAATEHTSTAIVAAVSVTASNLLTVQGNLCSLNIHNFGRLARLKMRSEGCGRTGQRDRRRVETQLSFMRTTQRGRHERERAEV